jgi:hypothetical protein
MTAGRVRRGRMSGSGLESRPEGEGYTQRHAGPWRRTAPMLEGHRAKASPQILARRP